jgi:hypothetical protein
MENQTKLILVKTIHTVIWIFFNLVIFYMLYAALTNRLDLWLWLGYGIICAEVFVLLVFKWFCPLTIIAHRYSDSEKDNFDIFLPLWLAKNNKLIYTLILTVVIFITLYQLFMGCS